MKFLVDAGASVVAMNAAAARCRGIDHLRVGVVGMVSTAFGCGMREQVALDSVKAGDIQPRNVEAAVLDGPHPPVVLLGMISLGGKSGINACAVSEILAASAGTVFRSGPDQSGRPSGYAVADWR